jgi:4-hydroxythreonine-4-phosphate dehydrogenase
VSNWIAIAIGDATGIGPEVALKAIAAEVANRGGDWRYLLIGDAGLLDRLNSDLRLELKLVRFSDYNQSSPVAVHSPHAPLVPNLSHGAPEAARAAITWLRDGATRCLTGETAALVTAPVNKESIIRTGETFVGQTEFLSALAGTDRTVMMLLGTDERDRWLRVALATTHLPLRRVADSIDRTKIELAIERASEACVDLRLPRRRVGVCGLNPHAGEGGQFGDEEQKLIRPAVEASRAKGIDVVGPLPADTLFHYAYRGDYDAVVAMYHDQGLAPLKMVAFDSGINWTLGLPFIRTSPDHGTAYDIAGKNAANPSSMIAALRLAKQLALQKRK